MYLLQKEIYAAKHLSKKYGRLTVDRVVQNGAIRTMVEATCECGEVKTYVLYLIINGNTKSCGCLKRQNIKEMSLTHGLSSHLLYGIWCNIKRRCNIEGSEVYNLYGAKGVRICDEWAADFKVFYTWCIENGWKKGLEVDKDLKSVEKPGKLYSPETCSIVTPSVNGRNKRTTEFITYENKTLSLQDWADYLNIPYKIVWQRIKRNGWTIERMIKEPGLVEHSNYITYNNETLRISEWSRRYNITISAIKKRLKKGWSIGAALETPIDQRLVTNKKVAA